MLDISGLVRSGVSIFPSAHNAIYSHAQLSDERKNEINLRRDKLKVVEDDSFIVRVVVEELLSYKPRFLTLDDRYLQLEKILDAVDKARLDKNTDKLSLVCLELHKELSESPGHLKNALLDCLSAIKKRIEHVQFATIKARL